MKNLILRNLRLYFRDKTAVFFSFLSVFIIIGLYALFLEKTLTSGYGNAHGVKFLINSWLCAGILTVTSVTTPLGTLGTLVNDRTRKIYRDFAASPIPRRKIAGGYIVSAFTVSFILSLAAFAAAEGFIVCEGGKLLAPAAVGKILALLLISAFSGSTMMFFLVSFLSSQSAYATASTIVGTLIGFLTGIYVPIGALPDSVQSVVRFFPLSHSAMLMRQIMMQKATSATFAGAPAGRVEKFRLSMGVVYRFGGQNITAFWSICFLLGSSLLFCVLSVLVLKRKRKSL